MDYTPNRVDAATIRERLKRAGFGHYKIKITSGPGLTYIKVLNHPAGSRVVTEHTLPTDRETVDNIARALRPLWNDERVVVRYTDTVVIRREGWHRTSSLAAELDVLQENGVPRQRIEELREHSTHVERVAELDAALPRVPLEILRGNYYFQLVAVDDHRLMKRHVREEHFSTNPFSTVSNDPDRLVHDLLVAVIKRRHPIRRPQRVTQEV